MPERTTPLDRAQGCLLAHLAGDALGSQVEFMTAAQIAAAHPDGGPRDLGPSAQWGTLPGQPTDDGEMMLALARALAERGTFDPAVAHAAYVQWRGSHPFDCGTTIANALAGRPGPQSQANGALMRAAPLGVLAARHGPAQGPRLAAVWARADAALTHPHPVSLEANALYAVAIARAVAGGGGAADIVDFIDETAAALVTEPALAAVVTRSREAPPAEYQQQMGWVLIALGNALWQLGRGAPLEEALVDTVRRGGDTDTNACICGGLLGSVYGILNIPARWLAVLRACRPDRGGPGDATCRPAAYWPGQAEELAARMLGVGRA